MTCNAFICLMQVIPFKHLGHLVKFDRVDQRLFDARRLIEKIWYFENFP